MEKEKDSLHVIATSSASSSEYPDNINTSFVNILPQSIAEAATDYEVGFESICIANQFGNVPSSVYGSNEHILIYLHKPFQLEEGEEEGWIENTVPNISISLKGTRYTAGSLVNYIKSECRRQLTDPDLFAWHDLIFMAIPSTRLDMVTMRVADCTVLIRECLAAFLMSETQMEKYQRLTRSDGQKYLVLRADGPKLFVMERVIVPARKVYPRLIKVCLKEMVQHVRNVSLPQELYMFAVDKSNISEGSIFYTVEENREYFPINQTRLEQLTINLVDENNCPIRVGGGGHATFVKLHFRRKASNNIMQNYPPLRMSSRQSIDVYPNNRANNFKVQLTDLLLPAANMADRNNVLVDWEVSLSSIYIPTRINYDKIVSDESDGIWVEIKLGRGAIVRILFDLPKDLSCEEFVTQANEVLKEAEVDKVWGEGVAAPLKFSEKIRGELYAEFSADLRIRVSGLFLYLLGRADSMRATPALFNIEKNSLEHMGHLDFYRLHPSILMIHCDFVSITALGNNWSNVLQMIKFPDAPVTRRKQITSTANKVATVDPVPVAREEGDGEAIVGQQGEFTAAGQGDGSKVVAIAVEAARQAYLEEEEKPIEFVLHRPRQGFMPVAQTDRNVLHFELRNGDGRPIDFADENAEVLITLEFRQKNSFEHVMTLPSYI